MFSKIMIPVDLQQVNSMRKALTVAASLASMEETELHIVGVTLSSPTEVAPSPQAFSEKLAAYAAECSDALGARFAPHTVISHDISVDLEGSLIRAAEELGADLIVMASHVPGLIEYVLSSNAGYVASHASISVFVVR